MMKFQFSDINILIQGTLTMNVLSDLNNAINIFEARGHPSFHPHQVQTLKHLVGGQNCLNQLPCGSGKTYPGISLPSILDILRDEFHHNISSETRCLLIVPLINIFYSLEVDLVKLDIPYQFLTAGSSCFIDPAVKVVVLSPEKLLEKSTLKSITSLSWSAVILDEPHLALGKLYTSLSLLQLKDDGFNDKF